MTSGILDGAGNAAAYALGGIAVLTLVVAIGGACRVWWWGVQLRRGLETLSGSGVKDEVRWLERTGLTEVVDIRFFIYAAAGLSSDDVARVEGLSLAHPSVTLAHYDELLHRQAVAALAEFQAAAQETDDGSSSGEAERPSHPRHTGWSALQRSARVFERLPIGYLSTGSARRVFAGACPALTAEADRFVPAVIVGVQRSEELGAMGRHPAIATITATSGDGTGVEESLWLSDVGDQLTRRLAGTRYRLLPLGRLDGQPPFRWVVAAASTDGAGVEVAVQDSSPEVEIVAHYEPPLTEGSLQSLIQGSRPQPSDGRQVVVVTAQHPGLDAVRASGRPMVISSAESEGRIRVTPHLVVFRPGSIAMPFQSALAELLFGRRDN